MDAVVDRDAIREPLELLGICASEERTYRALLECHAASAAAIAARLGIALRIARKWLDDLGRLGLATCTPGAPATYVATPPEFAITALVKQRQAALERARIAIPALERESANGLHADGRELALDLEPVADAERLGLVMQQMYKSARSEMLCFMRVPIMTPGVVPGESLRSGVRVRSISDNGYLAVPGSLARIEQDVARGEDARTVATLPFKMMIFDSHAAVIGLDAGDGAELRAYLLHGDQLVAILRVLFECVWSHATPIRPGRTGPACAYPTSMQNSRLARVLVPMLAAGFNDKAIAAELGISSATLNRRISGLMKATGARTRFQLGWQLASGETQPSMDGTDAAH